MATVATVEKGMEGMEEMVVAAAVEKGMDPGLVDTISHCSCLCSLAGSYCTNHLGVCTVGHTSHSSMHNLGLRSIH